MRFIFWAIFSMCGVGDDDDGPFIQSIKAALADFAQATPVFVQHGNRDFLLGEKFAAESGHPPAARAICGRALRQTLLISAWR